ncbi:uncharacterized protein [Drosophila pseudoobscura]|uniref:Uncharacterized protein n=1 Tax=Drosophila pseudoobscura pseudoobscura TaxID=46245 RepID=A0A6I8VRX0_DROPS|nr:uncharacterized protein LOC117183578 [Drosophila pseudoobscura]
MQRSCGVARIALAAHSTSFTPSLHTSRATWLTHAQLERTHSGPVVSSSSLQSTFSDSSVPLQEIFRPGSSGCIPCRFKLNGSSSPRCPHRPSSLPGLPLDGASPSALATYRSGGTGTRGPYERCAPNINFFNVNVKDLNVVNRAITDSKNTTNSSILIIRRIFPAI